LLVLEATLVGMQSKGGMMGIEKRLAELEKKIDLLLERGEIITWTCPTCHGAGVIGQCFCNTCGGRGSTATRRVVDKC
jgi:RecJ-like exonuclease